MHDFTSDGKSLRKLVTLDKSLVHESSFLHRLGLSSVIGLCDRSAVCVCVCVLFLRARAISYRQHNREAVGGFFSQIGDLYMVHHLWGEKDHMPLHRVSVTERFTAAAH